MSADPLFEPLQVKATVLRNRFVMPAMQRGFLKECTPTAAMAAYLEGCARGGMGLIITEGTGPDHPSAFWQGTFGVLRREDQAIWRDIVSRAKSGGAALLVQLWHAGSCRVVPPESAWAKSPTLSPSGLLQAGRPNGAAMTARDIEEIRDAFVRAALFAQEIGADGVEIHAAHGYLLDQFLWHETNIRTDEYGGATLAERARFPRDVVAAVRATCGDDFLISFRFSQWKEVDYEARIVAHPDELRPAIGMLRAAGVDIFNVSTRRFDRIEWPELDPRRTLAGWVKSMTDAAVIAVGSVGLNNDIASNLFGGKNPELQVERDLERVRAAMAEGQFDLVGIGRAQIANPDFVARVQRGEIAALRSFDRDRHLAEFFANFDPESGMVSIDHAGGEGG